MSNETPKIVKREAYRKLRESLASEFGAVLDSYRERKLLKPKQIEDMKSGFSDGMNNLLRGLIENKILKLED